MKTSFDWLEEYKRKISWAELAWTSRDYYGCMRHPLSWDCEDCQDEMYYDLEQRRIVRSRTRYLLSKLGTLS